VCSAKLYDKVLRWWFLCALERDCMAPTSDIFCKFHRRREYGKCHRFDQSALNILLANYANGDYGAYVASTPGVCSVNRGSSGKEQLSLCDSNHSISRIKSDRFL